MEIELLRANIGDAKRITCHAGIMRRKRSGYVRNAWKWKLGMCTILQESRNCHLCEKRGYRVIYVAKDGDWLPHQMILGMIESPQKFKFYIPKM